MSKTATSGKRLLVSDIDGTLLDNGDPVPGLDALRALLSVHRREVRLVYATGRSFKSTRSLIASGCLPEPDGIAAFIGTEVWLPPWKKNTQGFLKNLSLRWNRESVLDAAVRFPSLELQPEELQTPNKVSFYVNDFFSPHSFSSELKIRGIRAKILYSCSRYLDVLPERAGKRDAVEHIRRLWDIPKSHVLACGDSGNDRDLLEDKHFLGVVVGNSQTELRELAGSNTLHKATLPFAEGILEGALVYGFWPSHLPRQQFAGQHNEVFCASGDVL